MTYIHYFSAAIFVFFATVLFKFCNKYFSDPAPTAKTMSQELKDSIKETIVEDVPVIEKILEDKIKPQ